MLSGCASSLAFHSSRMLSATAIELFGEPRVAALAEAACAGDVAAVNAAVAGSSGRRAAPNVRCVAHPSQ